MLDSGTCSNNLRRDLIRFHKIRDIAVWVLDRLWALVVGLAWTLLLRKVKRSHTETFVAKPKRSNEKARDTRAWKVNSIPGANERVTMCLKR